MIGTLFAMAAVAAQPVVNVSQEPPSTTPLTSQSPSSNQQSEPIQPTPSPGQAPSGVTPYPASFFTRFQPVTAADMVDDLPGFVFDGGDSVRGFASAAGNVLIDGARPASKSDDLQSILRRLPASQVERIEVIRGGAPGVDMQGKTVLANVIRKKSSGVSGTISVSGDYIPNDGRQLPGLRLVGQDRIGSTLIEGSFSGIAYQDDGAGDGPEVETAPNGERLSKTNDKTRGGGNQFITTGALTTPAFGGAVRANGQLLGQTYIYDEVAPNVASLSIRPLLEHDRQNKEQGEFGLTYDLSLGSTLSVETLFIQQIQGEDYLTLYSQTGDSEFFREGHTNGESILRSTATYTFSAPLTFEAGAEGDYNWLFSHTTYVVNSSLQNLPAADVHIGEARGELFGKATWIVNSKLTLEAGMRAEVSHIASTGDAVVDKTLFYPKPRLVLTWSPEDADQFRWRVEEVVSQLDFNNYVAAPALNTGQVYAGDPNLVPQQALVFEAAYERRFLGAGDVNLTYRHSILTDVIDRAPVVSSTGDYDSPANIGSGTEDELISAFSLPLDHFRLPGALIKGNFTWRTSSVIDPTTGMRRPISGVRPREGQIEFNQDLPKVKLRWGAILLFGWRQPYYRFSEVEVDNLRPIGELFAEYQISPNTTFRLEINNIGEDFRRTLEVYPDLRSTTKQEYTDIRDLYFHPSIHWRLRRSF